MLKRWLSIISVSVFVIILNACTSFVAPRNLGDYDLNDFSKIISVDCPEDKKSSFIVHVFVNKNNKNEGIFFISFKKDSFAGALTRDKVYIKINDTWRELIGSGLRTRRNFERMIENCAYAQNL